jgi:tetratricopeptide (TPR) repeat protein
MKRLQFALITLLLIFNHNAAAQEQVDNSPWTGGCDERAIPVVEAISGRFEYAEACEVYLNCQSLVDTQGEICRLRAAHTLLESCNLDDRLCRNEAFMHTIAMTILLEYETYFASLPGIRDVFLQVLDEFVSGETQQALETIQSPPFDAIGHPDLLAVQGLLYDSLGMADEALQAYSDAIQQHHDYAILRYARGLLLAELGRADEASFDAAWLENYISAYAPDLLLLIEPFIDDFPLDESRFTTWLKYPVTYYTFSPGFPDAEDYTLVPPTSVQIGIYDELDRLLIIDPLILPTLHEGMHPTLSPQVYTVPWADGAFGTPDDSYSVRLMDYYAVSFEQSDDLFTGEEFRSGFEFGEYLFFLLSPQEQPDPRTVFGERLCEGGVISRLRPGMSVYISPYQESLFGMEPGEPSRFGFPTRDFVTLLDERTCLGNQLWWNAQDSAGNIGWVAENLDNIYVINPEPQYADPRLFYCPESPPLRLAFSMEAVVSEGIGSSYLFEHADAHTNITGTVPRGGIVLVVEGPVCEGDSAWWLVGYGEQYGWMPEGTGDTYWLEPL